MQLVYMNIHVYSCIFMEIYIIKIAELVSSSFLNQATASLGGYFFNFLASYPLPHLSDLCMKKVSFSNAANMLVLIS